MDNNFNSPPAFILALRILTLLPLLLMTGRQNIYENLLEKTLCVSAMSLLKRLNYSWVIVVISLS